MSLTPPPKDALAGTSVVARADALMQRRRAQVELDDLPVLTDAVPMLDDDDFPVLTAVAAETNTPAPTQASPPTPSVLPSVSIGTQAFEELAQELTKTITARLNAELPHLVHIALQETLVNIEKELRSGIGEATDAALRDFLKDQKRRK